MNRGKISFMCDDFDLDQWMFVISCLLPAILDILDSNNIDIGDVKGHVGNRDFVAIGATFYEAGDPNFECLDDEKE